MKKSRIKKNWLAYCECTYNSLKSNLYNWGNPEHSRPITRFFYIGVFDCGIPNPTGLISENALQNKLEKKKTVHDHFLSPQFIGRMILDNPDKYLSDFEIFKSIFWDCCQTIVVTQKENETLASLTENDGVDYIVKVPTHLKYNHLGIKLLKKTGKHSQWKNSTPIESNILQMPQDLIEYEKKFLI